MGCWNNVITVTPNFWLVKSQNLYAGWSNLKLFYCNFLNIYLTFLYWSRNIFFAFKTLSAMGLCCTYIDETGVLGGRTALSYSRNARTRRLDSCKQCLSKCLSVVWRLPPALWFEFYWAGYKLAAWI